MQAQTTVTTKRFGVNLSQAKLAAVAFSIIGSIALGGAAISVTSNDASPVQQPTAAVAKPKTTSNTVVMEMNQLPQATTIEIPNYALLDLNVLPEASAVVHPNYALLDLNILPGDDIDKLPPIGRDGDRY